MALRRGALNDWREPPAGEGACLALPVAEVRVVLICLAKAQENARSPGNYADDCHYAEDLARETSSTFRMCRASPDYIRLRLNSHCSYKV